MLKKKNYFFIERSRSKITFEWTICHCLSPIACDLSKEHNTISLEVKCKKNNNCPTVS